MKIHENVNVIDKYACSLLCNLTFVELPKNLVIIDNYGFSYCESLKTINFPETLISINYNGFYKCTSLEELKFPPNLETICSFAFGNCKSLKSVDIPDSLMDLGISCFEECILLSSFHLPPKLKGINEGLFYGCEKLTSLTLPSKEDSIESFTIGKGAFKYSGLKSIIITDAVVSIGSEAFSFCKLDSVTIDNGLKTIGNSAFSYDDISSLTLPDSVTSIGDNCFEYCSALQEVHFGNCDLTLGNFSFYHCERLETVTMGNGQIVINDSAFSNCVDLVSITLSNNTISIGSKTFYNCYRLKSMVIPGSVRKIGDKAFASSGLDFITYIGWREPICSHIVEHELLDVKVLPEYEERRFCNIYVTVIEPPTKEKSVESSYDEISFSNQIDETTFSNHMEKSDMESFDETHYAEITPTISELTPEIIINDTLIKDNIFLDESLEINSQNASEIKTEIEKIFKKSKSKNNKDKILNISTKGRTIVFENLSLQNDQFIKLDENANVALNKGPLNLYLNEESKSVTINIENINDTQISIKNQGKCSINIKSQDNYEDTVNVSFNSHSEIYNPLQINVENNVESLLFDSINLHNFGAISASKINDRNDFVPIKINNLSIQPNATSMLNNAEIINEISISQTSSLQINEVKFDSTKMNINLQSYSHSDFEKPMITGTFKNPPISITLNQQNDNVVPPDNSEYILFSGHFTYNCNNWTNVIQFGSTLFNENSCISIYGLHILDENSSLIVRYNDNQQNHKKHKKLSGGQIAGIVIGCVAFCVLVIVIVIVILKKKKAKTLEKEKHQVVQENIKL